MWVMMNPPGRTSEGLTEIREHTLAVTVLVRVLVPTWIVI
jgi:hypothetical protein